MKRISFRPHQRHTVSRVFQASSFAVLVASSVSAANAQEQTARPQGPAASDPDQNKVVVTGSRIRGVAPVGSNLIQVGIEDIKRSGAVTTAELLKEIPQITSMGFNSEGSLGAAAASNITRASAPNLRGIGPQATLTLLDGQRVPAAGTMGNIVDPSFLPPLALQRIEVVADGASAVYGSDAVAGVVNLIPRKRFQGLQTMARVGHADAYHDAQAGAIAGKAWGSGSVFLSFDYAHNNGLQNSDRGFIGADRRRFGGADARPSTCAPGTLSYGGTSYPLGGGSGQGLLLSRLPSGPANRCETTPYTTLIPETDRGSVFAYAEQKLGDSMKVYAQAFYYSRESESARALYTITNYTVPKTNAFYPADALAGTTPLLASYSFSDVLGPNFATVKSRVGQFLAGIDGDLGSYHYKLTASTGLGGDKEENLTALNNYALAQAMASANPASALNVFGGPQANSPALLQQLATGQSIIRGNTHLNTLAAGVDGPLFSLPGGEVRTAVGAEVRRESSDAYYSTNANSRTSTTPTVLASRVSRTIKAVYGELLVPIVGAGNQLPLLSRLDLSLAGRWEKYSDVGTTTNPKVGLNWKPVDDVLVHASYGRSFRAPWLSESNPNASGSNVYIGQQTVPGRGLVPTVTLGGGNPDLQPEKAVTKSLGIDFSPASMRSLKAGMSYFDISYDNQIVDGFGLQGNYLLDPATYAKYVAYPGAPNYAALKNLIEASPFTTPGTINYTNAAIMDARRTNTAAVKVHGLDFQLSNAWRLENAGTVTLRGNFTHYLKYDEAPNAQVFLDRNNVIAYPAKNSGRVSAAWALGGMSAQLSANYANSYRNNLSILAPTVGAYTTLDLDLAYSFDQAGMMEGVRISLNARNLADKKPPFADYGNGYDPSKASALGRIVALTLNKEW